MSNSLLISLSNQMVLRRHMDIVANNLANVTTTGFKTETPLFEEYLLGSSGAERAVSANHFVRDYGVYRDLGAGKIVNTDRPLDIAINGDAYLMVGTDQGTRYSRGGALSIDDNGQLVTDSGDPVLDENHRPVTLPIENTELSISKEGVISNQDGELGRIGVVTFTNPQALKKVGENLLETSQNAVPAKDFEIVQGSLESSNVQPVVEMTKLITINQAYQQTSKFIETNTDLTRRMIQTLGRGT